MQSRFECIRVARGDTPGTPGAAVAPARGMPLDVAEKAVTRLGWVATLGATTTVFVNLLATTLSRMAGLELQHSPLMSVSLGAVVSSSAIVAALAWTRRVPPQLMLDLGLLYMVFGAFWIAVVENCTALAADLPMRGISWICLWVTIFPLAVPHTLGKTLLAAFSAAAMAPAGLFAQVAFGAPAPGSIVLTMYVVPIVISSTWSILLGRFVHRLERDMSKAREFGSYSLLELIGKGGMGEVWRARHRMLARDAAIKLIHPSRCADDPDRADVMLRRFQREAQATARLRSPHTVGLYDFGRTEEGSFFYAMELLDGLDLERLVSRFGPQPAPRVARILRQACDSLAEAHASGLTHRDIKPRNMFLCRLGLNHDFVKVLDFGLVKVDFEETQTQLTRDGSTTGTPAYMAPEMALGNPGVDARADLYALGCVGYWLLTGTLVFEAENAMAMAMAHVQSKPIPPSQRTELEIPPEFEGIILSCLEKSPEDRPQSARELGRLLEECRFSEQWTEEDAERWWRMHLPSAHLLHTPASAGAPMNP